MTVTNHQFTPSHDHQKALRRAFGCFATGVTIVTAQTADGPIGMTANSFSSISLDPPLVLWSAATQSKRHDHFANAKTFCIHVLGAHQLHLAQHFARFGSDFEDVVWNQGPVGAPQVAGCLAEFHCSTHAIHPAGDHSIIIGEVIHVLQRDPEAQGLLFDKGRFGTFSTL